MFARSAPARHNRRKRRIGGQGESVMAIETLLQQLNAGQHAAATLAGGHALVLAGAGTGKTRTIIARAAYLIAAGVPANRIQILTFTRRAASEVVERVRLTLAERSHGLRASTFHTWCAALLRRAPQQFGIADFSVIDREDQLQMFKLIRGRSETQRLPTPAQIADLYSFARNTRRPLQQVLEQQLRSALPHKAQIAEMMREYERRKRARNYLDYDDMLDLVAQGMAQYPELRDWVARQYDHLLVDEMQDTNPLQWALLEPLAARVTLFCVGDDAQSIYAFRGADYRNVHRFSERLPGARVLKLEQNYRSTQEILDLANWLLAQSPLHYQRQLQAVRGRGLLPRLVSFADDWQESRWIAEDLLRRRAEGADWRRHMILVRSSYSARAVERALIDAEIPYIFIGGVKLLESAHVRDLLSVLRIIGNPQDELAWMRFLTLWPGIGDVSAARLVDRLLLEPQTDGQLALLATQRRTADEPLGVLQTAAVYQRQVAELVKMTAVLMHDVLEAKYRHQDWERRRRDFAFVAQLAEKHHSVGAFLEEYLLEPVYHSELQRSDDTDRVQLITVHSAKGTEREVCYLPDSSIGAYPSSRAVGDSEEVEEERRVLYVALTRAQNELILTRRSYNRWAHGRYRVAAELTAADNDDGDEAAIAVPAAAADGSDPLEAAYFLNDLPAELVEESDRSGRRLEPPGADGSAEGGRTIRFGIELD
jgi:DNA helicase II / ATP-dependent DNA helicase PcrA